MEPHREDVSRAETAAHDGPPRADGPHPTEVELERARDGHEGDGGEELHPVEETPFRVPEVHD
jgi:hypothetical protein